MQNILKRLQQIVGDQFDIDPDKVQITTAFVKELGADSLDVIEIVLKIEYEFDIDIEDQYASKVITVKDVLEYFEKKEKTR